MAPPLVAELVPPPEPISACERWLGAAGLVFLDGSADSQDAGRYSYLTADPVLVFRQRGRLSEAREPSLPWRRLGEDALSAAMAWLAAGATAELPDLPPFQGGVAGYFGYEWGAQLEEALTADPRAADLDLPEVQLGCYDWVIAWDLAAGRAWIVSTGLTSRGDVDAEAAARRLRYVRERLDRIPAATGYPVGPRRPAGVATHPIEEPDEAAAVGLRSTFAPDGYRAMVARAREYILAGDIFQANLSQRFEATLVGRPFDFYRRLRRINPAALAAYLELEGAVVASVSPERFLRLDPRGRVETRPIKGTRPRGADPAGDEALARELAASEKDRAENVMIVDLLRNDLSRVCRPGSVAVPSLLALERHPTVHHLVSTVTGELRPGLGAAELLRATFPGGSITGAPKIRAMEIIAELEPTRRDVYCGAIGYVSRTGAMDTSVAIRTCTCVGGRAFFHAGGGVVADSDPDQEYRETLDKARGIIAALAEGAGP